MSKGSKRRPSQVSAKEYGDNHDAIFRKKPQETKPDDAQETKQDDAEDES